MPYKRPSEKSLANLAKGKKWVKGQSGNPRGPAKMPDIKEAMTKLLAEERDGMSALEAVLTTLFKQALKGDTKAAEMLINRAYGQAKQEVEHSGQVAIKFVREKPGIPQKDED